MKILHLTDLHLPPRPPLADGKPSIRSSDEVRDELRSIWSGAARLIPGPTFDFVVISGDLTQQAAPEEYAGLKAFLEGSILDHVKRGDRRRIILVPGNHDVQWHTELGDKIDLGTPEGRTILANSIKEYGTNDLRVRWGAEGLEGVRIIQPARYPSRFRNLQAFLDEFYGSVEGPEDHAFALGTPEPAGHFSAHVFKEEDGVAFYGLSSCDRTDQDWHGAAISPRTLTEVAEHAKRHAPDLLRIVVWHHGLTSQRGHPDHLTTAELALIRDGLDPHLGIHGHTHEDEMKDLRESPRYGFPIIATGSFGAGPKERPSHPNQLSVLEVNGAIIRWNLFARDDARRWYRDHPERLRGSSTRGRSELLYAMKPRERRRLLPDDFDRSKIGVHTRRVLVDHDGIADVNVILEDVTLDGALVLGTPRHSFNEIDDNIVAEASALTGAHGHLEVERPPGTGAFVLTPPKVQGEHPPRDPLIQWKFALANGYALDGTDLEMRDVKGANIGLPDGYDGIAHHVRCHCEKLVLEVKLPPCEDQASGRIDDVKVRADRRSPAKDDPWEQDDEETKRILDKGTRVNEGGPWNAVRLTVEAPSPDYRYVLGYRLARQGTPLDPEIVKLLTSVLAACRTAHDTRRGLVGRLTLAMGDAILGVLDPRLDTGGGALGVRRPLEALDLVIDKLPNLWVGHLWHPGTKRLQATFGHFSAQSWGTQHAYGSGIVGHGFRTGKPTSFAPGAPTDWRMRREKTLYRTTSGDAPGPRQQREHDWIVCVPILIGPGLAPIGMVGFAERMEGAQKIEHAERWLAARAKNATGPGEAARDQKLLDLTTAVSQTFWFALASLTNDPDMNDIWPSIEPGRDRARQVLEDFWPAADHRLMSFEKPPPS